ncbi:MAG: hypothetical protein WC553_03375 [Patescibacteria group bacterium]|jgi:ribosomal protein S27E
MSAYHNDTGTVRTFGGTVRARPRQELDCKKEFAKINDFLVKIGKRPPDDSLLDLEECPNCRSRQLHRTAKRIRCQCCGTTIPRGAPTLSPEKVDGTP